MSAVLFGSISTVADTSELQRQAFNQAFESHGLDWHWEREDYLSQLEKSGGADRIAAYADARGDTVDAAAVHATKSKLFQASMAASALTPRPGVVDTIRDAKTNGIPVGLVTTTSHENVFALIDALHPHITADDFAVIVASSNVEKSKPDGAAYTFALKSLGEAPGDCVAIEDNIDGVHAAKSAGVTCVAFPNENTATHDFSSARIRVDRLDLDELLQLSRSL